MSSSVSTVLFAVAVGAVCSGLLVGTTQITAPYREANAKAEEIRNLLGAVGAPLDPMPRAAALLETFDRDVREKKIGDLVFFEYAPGGAGKPEAVAVPLAGMGLWGPVKGIMALEPDLVTIRAVRFYQQEETPGLGGEIGSERFQKQFMGKRIVSDDGKAGFRILKPGGVVDANSVDGITGATMTSTRVAKILDDASRAIDRQRATYGH